VGFIDWTIWRLENALSLVVSDRGSEGVNARLKVEESLWRSLISDEWYLEAMKSMDGFCM
jgi:hypothetical protein